MVTATTNLLFGKVLITLQRVKSTNSFAKDLLTKSKPNDGTAIIAYEQTDGKGQYGNVWEAEAGENLTFSLILYPQFVLPANQFLLNMMVSLGIRDALQHHTKQPVTIKWPNDIFCNGKKLGGILIENSIQGAAIADSIIGIGLNINQSKFSKSFVATSLANEASKNFDLNTIFQDLMTQLERRYLEVRAGRQDIIREAYLSHLHQKDVWCNYKSGQEKFKGKITGVDLAGRLLVETKTEVKTFMNKEIVYL